MRYFILIVFLYVFGFSFGQAENVPASPQKDSIDEKTVIEEKESLKKEQINDEYRMKSVEGVQTKKQTRTAPVKYKSAESEAPGAGAQNPKSQTIQSESANFGYYKSQSKTQSQQRSPTKDQQVQMNNAVSYFESVAPESFEFHFYKYTSGNYNTDLISHLLAAEKLKPNNADVQVQLVAYHMINQTTNEALVYLNKLMDNKRLTQSVVLYAQDVLRSVPQNGVLITHGFDDTYAAWYAQLKHGIRKDVRIISLDLMQSAQFRDELMEQGFILPTSPLIDVDYLSQFCAMNASKNLCIALTTPKDYFKPILSNVFLTGLVFEYKTTLYDNFWRNESLWNSHLKKELINDSVDDKGKSLSSNYLPMLFQMRKVYGQMEKNEKVREIDAVIDQIGAQSQKYQQVQKMKSAY